MDFERPQRQRHLVVATIGVTIAFGAAAVAGQVVFRGSFGPASAAVAAAGTSGTATAAVPGTAGGETTDAASLPTERVVLAAKSLGDGTVVQQVTNAADATAQLALTTVPTSEQVKAKVQAELDGVKVKAQQAATAAVQQKWNEVKADTAAAALGAATAAGDKIASSPALTDLKSPAAQRQVQAVGNASVSLWQSLWEIFTSLWKAFLGIFKK